MAPPPQRHPKSGTRQKKNVHFASNLESDDSFIEHDLLMCSVETREFIYARPYQITYWDDFWYLVVELFYQIIAEICNLYRTLTTKFNGF